MFTITSISTGITALFFLAAGLSTFTSWKKRKEPLFKFFFLFFLFFGIQQIFFSLGTGVFSKNPTASNLAWVIAHVFMFLAISNFIRFPMQIRYPQSEKIVFKLALIASTIGAIILFYKLPEVKPFLLENGVFNWIVPSLSGAVIGIFTSVCLLFSSGIFIAEGRRSPDKIIKAKSYLIAIGILIFLIGGPIHNFVKTPLLNFIADFSLILGSLFMLSGVYLSRIFEPVKETPDKQIINQ